MLALAEQEAQTKAVIGKNFKSRRKAAKELRERLSEKLEGAALDDEAAEAALDNEEMKELQQADNEYQMRKKEVLDELEAKHLKRENDAINNLKQEQIDDRKRILTEYLPDDAEIQALIDSIDSEERKALQKFQKELLDKQKEQEEKMAQEQAALQQQLEN